MVVDKNQSCRVIIQCLFDNFPWINHRSGKTPLKEFYHFYNLITAVQKYHQKYFPVFIAEIMLEIIQNFIGRADKILIDDTIRQEPSGNSLGNFESEYIFIPYANDFFQF